MLIIFIQQSKIDTFSTIHIDPSLEIMQGAQKNFTHKLKKVKNLDQKRNYIKLNQV